MSNSINHEIAAEEVRAFKLNVGLIREFTNGEQEPVSLRSLDTGTLVVLAKAGRQIGALGAAAEKIVAQRHRQSQRNYDRDKKFAAVRRFSEQLRKDGYLRQERLERIALLGKADGKLPQAV